MRYVCKKCKYEFSNPIKEKKMVGRDPFPVYETWEICPSCNSPHIYKTVGIEWNNLFKKEEKNE